MQLHKEAFQCGTELYVNIFYCSLHCQFKLSLQDFGFNFFQAQTFCLRDSAYYEQNS